LQDNEKALKFARKARELAPNDPKIVGILGLPDPLASEAKRVLAELERN
jgi:hypothetical protein